MTKPHYRPRSEQLNVKLTPAEKESLYLRAAAQSLSPQAFIRKTLTQN